MTQYKVISPKEKDSTKKRAEQTYEMHIFRVS